MARADFFALDPEVAGGVGDNAVEDRSVHPPIVHRLHCQFDGWLGDALLAGFPAFIMTEAAKRAIEDAGLSGVSFGPVEVSTSTSSGKCSGR